MANAHRSRWREGPSSDLSRALNARRSCKRIVGSSLPVSGVKFYRPQDVIVAARIMLTHRHRTLIGHHHEGAGFDALLIEVLGIHEILDEEGQTMNATTSLITG